MKTRDLGHDFLFLIFPHHLRSALELKEPGLLSWPCAKLRLALKSKAKWFWCPWALDQSLVLACFHGGSARRQASFPKPAPCPVPHLGFSVWVEAHHALGSEQLQGPHPWHSPRGEPPQPRLPPHVGPPAQPGCTHCLRKWPLPIAHQRVSVSSRAGQDSVAASKNSQPWSPWPSRPLPTSRMLTRNHSWAQRFQGAHCQAIPSENPACGQ